MKFAPERKKLPGRNPEDAECDTIERKSRCAALGCPAKSQHAETSLRRAAVGSSEHASLAAFVMQFAARSPDGSNDRSSPGTNLARRRNFATVKFAYSNFERADFIRMPFRFGVWEILAEGAECSNEKRGEITVRAASPASKAMRRWMEILKWRPFCGARMRR